MIDAHPLDDRVTNGVFTQPSLWLPQNSPWALGALAAVADALLQGGCKVRIYDADFAGGNPLARYLTPAATGGTWNALAAAHRLPWWEVPLGALGRGEHVLIWLGGDNTPPEGWGGIAKRSKLRGFDTYWLPGDSSLGLPRTDAESGQMNFPLGTRWLALRTWSRAPRIRPGVEDSWRSGLPPRLQIGRRILWVDQAHAALAVQAFNDDLTASLVEV